MRRISDTLARMAAYSYPANTPDMPSRLTPLADFGSDPGALGSYCYLPPDLRPGAALVVVLHGCTQTAAGYDQGSGWSALADREGFALLYPEQRRANNMNLCFNWFERSDIARSGGEAQSIAQMVETMIATHQLDRNRVFVTGLSAGGAMAAVMLATYPDLFAAGAIIGGLPYGGATGMLQALDRMRGHGAASAAEAADAVRDAAGRVPRRLPAVSIWQGDADRTVVPLNADQLAGQWRAVHGLSAAPSETRGGPNWEQRVWRDTTGRAAVEQWMVAGMGHGVPIDPAGPEGLGEAGPYMLDVGLSSSRAIAESWGLSRASGGAKPEPRADRATARPASNGVEDPANGVQAIIARALRAAGLLH
ncbi:extracellular catalytic domain type 1 short-chain-length polyhydroxyalkanoate depolymerase [Sphingomonas sp. UYP23]